VAEQSSFKIGSRCSRFHSVASGVCDAFEALEAFEALCPSAIAPGCPMECGAVDRRHHRRLAEERPCNHWPYPYYPRR
jgi:hypothetical protein